MFECLLLPHPKVNPRCIHEEHGRTLVLFLDSFFSVFLGNIKDAFIKNPDLQNLLLDDFFKDAIHKCQVGHKIFWITKVRPLSELCASRWWQRGSWVL